MYGGYVSGDGQCGNMCSFIQTQKGTIMVYLSSYIGGSYKQDGIRVPAPLSSENGLLESLRKNWKGEARVLIVSADPDNIERNDSICKIFAEAFPISGLSIKEMTICDQRNKKIVEKIPTYDVLILSGGHVPTQNKFFRRIKLKEYLTDFSGILIGISAGSMNSAKIVYAQPELSGESIDPGYKRFFPGLGLTKFMILPHYQNIKDDILDGKRLFEDITYPDSYGREFFALVDGSYIQIENGITKLFGEAYRIKDGKLEQICKKDSHIVLE